MVSSLDSHDVRIYYRDTANASAAALDAARDTLSRDERERTDRFHFAEDRRDYMLAHDLLRRCLSAHGPLEPSEWRFGSTAHGKPFVCESSISFSLSHTRGLVACSLAQATPVGIDVEHLTRASDAQLIASRFFSPSESDLLARCSSDALPMRFVELWTLKEAFLKATGTGLTAALDDVSFGFEDNGMIEVMLPADSHGSGWQFALFEPAPCTRLAIAVQATGIRPLVARDVSAESMAVGDARLLQPVRVGTRRPASDSR